MNSTQLFPLSEAVVNLLFNSILYRSELVMYEKDAEANILWILDMHYVMLKYSGTCWMTSECPNGGRVPTLFHMHLSSTFPGLFMVTIKILHRVANQFTK